MITTIKAFFESAANFRLSWALLVTFLSVSLGAASCTPPSSFPGPGTSLPQRGPDHGRTYHPDQDKWITPPHMVGTAPVRVALLLPLSAPQPEIQELADSLRKAAELALFAQPDDRLLLMVRDTKGTDLGATDAAFAAVDQGAEIILGPLFSASVSAVADVAHQAHVPVVAFSTDREVAGDGVYLLSFMLETELDAVAKQATSEGLTRFAMMIPEGLYGRRVSELFPQILSKYGGVVVHTEYYTRDPSAILQPAQRLAAPGVRGSYDAVLIPEGGNMLRSLAPALAYYGIDPRQVRYFGTGLWDDPSVQRETSLRGGQFPAPSPELRRQFFDTYKSTYKSEPPRLASLGFDAVLLAAHLAQAGERGQRFQTSDFTTPNGFSGVDGIYRFRPDGVTERGLAILQITRDGVDVVKPAPQAFDQATAYQATPGQPLPGPARSGQPTRGGYLGQ